MAVVEQDGRTPLMAGLISCRAMGSTAAELTRLLLETEETYPSKINVNAKDYVSEHCLINIDGVMITRLIKYLHIYVHRTAWR